jgi:hypothetical protein
MRLATRKSANPLDATMTPTQVVRRKFKSGLPRTIQNRVLSKMEAMARTMELFDKLRDDMAAAGLKKSDVEAGLVYSQPETKGRERMLADTVDLPTPEDIGTFVEKVMDLHKPMFLGVIFIQHDPKAEKEEYQDVAFVWPFMGGPEAEGRLLAARSEQLAKRAIKKAGN